MDSSAILWEAIQQYRWKCSCAGNESRIKRLQMGEWMRFIFFCCFSVWNAFNHFSIHTEREREKTELHTIKVNKTQMAQVFIIKWNHKNSTKYVEKPWPLTGIQSKWMEYSQNISLDFFLFLFTILILLLLLFFFYFLALREKKKNFMSKQ